MNQRIIIDLILNEIDKVSDHSVTDIIYGAHIVAIKSRKMGIATWAGNIHPVPLNMLPDPAKDYSAKELVRFLESKNPLEASLGLAAVNSLLPDIPVEKMLQINAGDLILELGNQKTVAVIGHFPFVAKMQNKFETLLVFEKKPHQGDLEDSLIPTRLPEADLVAITATTLSNQSLGHVLTHCSKDAVKIMIGPSTPVSPALFELGFHYVAGIIADDYDKIKEGVLAGHSFKHLKGVKHVILKA